MIRDSWWANPFQVGTTIRSSLSYPGPVDPVICDTAGRRAKALLTGAWRHSGPNGVSWDSRDLQGATVSGGAYFARLQAGGVTADSPLVLIR